MKIDGNIDESEIKHLEEFIHAAQLNSEDEMELISQITQKELINIDYEAFKDNPDEAIVLMLDLVTLANIDGKVHVAEKMFIKNIAQRINFS